MYLLVSSILVAIQKRKKNEGEMSEDLKFLPSENDDYILYTV